MGDISKSVVVLALISACSAGLISGVRAFTANRIEMQQLIFEKKPALETILKHKAEDAIAKRYYVIVNGNKHNVFPVKNESGQRLVVIESKGYGYSGEIGVLVATEINTDRITGVAISSHNETPGIGAEANYNTDFISQFAGKHIGSSSLMLTSNGGEINAISGATRTSAGIVSAINNSSLVLKEICQQQKPATD